MNHALNFIAEGVQVQGLHTYEVEKKYWTVSIYFRSKRKLLKVLEEGGMRVREGILKGAWKY